MRSNAAAAPSVCGQQSRSRSGWQTERRGENLVDRDLVLEVGVRVEAAVVVVLHRHGGEHLAGGAELVHVPGGERREQHRRRLAAVVERVAGGRTREQALCGRLVAHLLDADHEDDIGGHPPRPTIAPIRNASEPDGHAFSTRVTRDPGQPDALTAPCCRRFPLGPTGVPRWVATIAGSICVGIEALVDALDRGPERACGHLLVALVEQLAELDHARRRRRRRGPSSSGALRRVPPLALNP